MVRFIKNPISDLSFILKRLWRQRGLVACVALGLVLATGLAVTIPLYADAANYNLLNTALASSAAQSHRPPFTIIFNYVGSWHNPITVAQYMPANQYMENQLQSAIGLPLETLTRLVSTDNLQLYPNHLSINRSQRLDLVKLTFVSGVFDQVTLVEGRFPQAVTQIGASIEVLVSLQEANDLNLKTGSTYLLYSPNQVGGKAF
jgi:putative ABC transport system permease protein